MSHLVWYEKYLTWYCMGDVSPDLCCLKNVDAPTEGRRILLQKPPAAGYQVFRFSFETDCLHQVTWYCKFVLPSYRLALQCNLKYSQYSNSQNSSNFSFKLTSPVIFFLKCSMALRKKSGPSMGRL